MKLFIRKGYFSIIMHRLGVEMVSECENNDLVEDIKTYFIFILGCFFKIGNQKKNLKTYIPDTCPSVASFNRKEVRNNTSC